MKARVESNLDFYRPCQRFTKFSANTSGCHQTPKRSQRDQKQSAQTIGKLLRKRTKIVRRSDRCNKACALARNLPNYPVSASKNDAQGVLGRAPASKIGVRRAKVERQTLKGRQKIDRQPPEERQSAEEPEGKPKENRRPRGQV